MAENLSGDPTPRDRISDQSSWGLIDNPYGYCGYYADGETAAAKVLGPALASGGSGCLYHVRYRVYDPIAGRWLTRDPAGFVDGMNTYEYCGGGATSCFDPLGLFGDPFDAENGPSDFLRARNRDFESGRLIIAEARVAALEGAVVVTTAVLTILIEPLDWLQTGAEIVAAPANPASYAGLLPFVPASAGRALKIGSKIAAVADTELLKLTRRNFSENLRRVTGMTDEVIAKHKLKSHHIVAAEAKGAKEAREILEKHGIDVNDPQANGMWLPEDYHKHMHSKEYYENVNERLKDADKRGRAAGGDEGAKQAVLDELDKIKQEHLDEAGKASSGGGSGSMCDQPATDSGSGS